MSLGVLEFLKILEFGRELLNSFLGGDALIAKQGDFVGLLRRLGKRRGHGGGGTGAREIQLGLRRLRRIGSGGRGGYRLAGKFFFQAIEEIEFEAAVGGKDLIAGLGDVAIGVPGGDFC